MRVPSGRKAPRDRLEQRVTQEALGQPGRQGPPGPPGPRVIRVRMGRLGILVTLGHKARRVPRVLLETRDRQGRLEIRALRDLPVRLGSPGLLE